MEEKEIITESVENREFAEPEGDVQSHIKTEVDSNFADMRRKQQLDKLRLENAKYKKQLEGFGVNFSENIQDDKLETKDKVDTKSPYNKLDEDAEKNEIETDEIENFAKNQEFNLEKELQDAFTQEQRTENDDVTEIFARLGELGRTKIEKMAADLEFYKNKEIHSLMDSDLKEIQSIEPKITTIEDLPPLFLALRFNENAPMSAKEAFVTMKTIEQQTKQPKPSSTGSVVGSGTVESEFFTSEELDKLDSTQLSDPKIFEKAMKSVARLK